MSSISDIYPETGWPDDYATITGTIFTNDGVTPVTGINVVVRNVADPWRDCNSMLSGAFSQGMVGPDGRFHFHGLKPGDEYVVYVDAIVAGGFSTPRPVPFPGPEEYWNGASENADPDVDPICAFETISATPGSPFRADVIMNFGLFLEDDAFIEAPLPFSFPFCGGTWNRVFVGSNGYLTFGSGDVDFSPTLGDFRDGIPRIAPFWTDLNPVLGGSITVAEQPDAWTVQYANIPDFSGVGANSFSVTLRPSGAFDVLYGNMTALNGLAGRTEGGGVPDPGELDLSGVPPPIGTGSGTVYELFDAGDNDLSGLTLQYGLCAPFEFVFDRAEPGVPYASTGGGGATKGSLLTIDPTTGAGTMVGRTGRERVPGLAISSAHDIWGSSGGGASQLLHISASDAVTQVVATIRNAATGQPLPFVDAIAFDSSDVLYAIDVTNTLWTVDTSSGLAARIGFTGLAPEPFLAGLGFDPTSGRLYASTGGFGGTDAIYEIDPLTGAATLVGNTGLGSGAIPDIAFNDNGALFASKMIEGAPTFIRVDTETAAGTVIGVIGFPSVSGLAWSAHDVIEAILDIRPGECPNEFDVRCFRSDGNKPGGLLPLAVVGTATFDARAIDATSVRLEGVAPVRSKLKDAAAPPGGAGDDDDDDGDRRRDDDDDHHGRRGNDDDDDDGGSAECPCTDRRKDGRKDMVFHFRNRDIAAVIEPGRPGEERALTLTGLLADGTPFQASDCVRFVGHSHRDTAAPSGPRLGVPYPNPFNPVTRIDYELPETARVTLSVHDVEGRLVDVLVSGDQTAGRHVVEWDGSRRASGIYFFRLVAGDRTETRKMILLK
jgi:hypothetical protein